MLSFLHTSSTLVSPFAFKNPNLFFRRVHLGLDEVVLTGWTWRGRYRRSLSFDRILHVDARGSNELILWLFDGEALRLHIDQARQWKKALQTHTVDSHER